MRRWVAAPLHQPAPLSAQGGTGHLVARTASVGLGCQPCSARICNWKRVPLHHCSAGLERPSRMPPPVRPSAWTLSAPSTGPSLHRLCLHSRAPSLVRGGGNRSGGVNTVRLQPVGPNLQTPPLRLLPRCLPACRRPPHHMLTPAWCPHLPAALGGLGSAQSSCSSDSLSYQVGHDPKHNLHESNRVQGEILLSYAAPQCASP